MSPGTILLLSTYELGHQPLHLASPLGFLQTAGYSARAIDLAVDPLDEAAVAAARFVGIAVPMHTALRLGMRVGRRVRELNPTCHICFYGLYAPLHRELLLKGLADSVIGGEYEAELVSLVERLAQSERVAPVTAERAVVLERLRFSAPGRRSLPLLSRYAHLVADGEERPSGYVEASRGCRHLCRHCPIPSVYQGRFFVVPEAVVLADVAQQVAAGARHVTLGDPDFFNGPEHAMRIARALRRAHPELTFDVTIKIEHLLKHRAYLAELARLGCLFVVSAVESLSPRALELLAKGHTRDDIDVALDLVATAGMALRPSLVPFTPFTSLDDYLELLEWIEARELIENVDSVHLAIRLLIPAGSKLLELDEVRQAVGPFDPEKLSYVWSHPDPRMDELAAAALAIVAAQQGDSAGATFDRIKALAYQTAGRPAVGRVRSVTANRRPPRLTEAWFC